jgi:hypothetical protein
MMISYIDMFYFHKQLCLPDTRTGSGANMYQKIIILDSRRKFCCECEWLTKLETNPIRVFTSVSQSHS